MSEGHDTETRPFLVGDRVKCIKADWLAKDTRPVVGTEAVVKEVSAGTISLRGFRGWYPAKGHFEILAATSPAPAPKFEVGQRVVAKCNVFPTGMKTYEIEKGTDLDIVAVPSERHLQFTLGGYRYPADCFEPIAEPEPFRVDKPGVYEQLDSGEATVEKRNTDGNWFGLDSIGSPREWLDDGAHLYKNESLRLIRFLRPLDAPSAPQPEPDPVDGGKVEALARELFVRFYGVSESLAFDEAEKFYVEAAKRGK